MRVFRRIAALLVLLALAPGAAVGQDDGTTGIAFRPSVEATIDNLIIPGYAAFADAAGRQAGSLAALCEAADPAALAAAQRDFARLVETWSRVEMFRIGPAREDNRSERLLFWPDRRGLGLRQVQAILAEEDETATDAAALRGKSVAVQGLLALEYVLFGTGNESLAANDPESFRCRYGRAVAEAIARVARELHDAWSDPAGFASAIRNAAADSPVYRSHGEVVQEFLQLAREQLQMDRDLKLARALGEAPEAANPRRSPFWRSDQTLPSIIGNIETVLALQDRGGLGALLPAGSEWHAKSLAFELAQAERAIADVEAKPGRWEEQAVDPTSHQRLAYALIPLGGAVDLLENGYPQALGLITGFNSLDGD